MDHPKLFIMIVADCDPDRPDYGGASYADPAGLVWVGTEEGVPRAREALTAIPCLGGNADVPVTWCVRSDWQMGEIYREPAWPYIAYRALWDDLVEAGHELAWHPHVWRWSGERACWYQETEDAEWTEECWTRGLAALETAAGHRVSTVRTGWNYHSNLTMGLADRLGLRADCSALPSESSTGGGNRGSDFHGAFDWSVTPDHPYYPSAADYRRPTAQGETALRVLEIPLTPSPSLLLAAATEIRGAARAKRLPRLSAFGHARHAFRITARPSLYRPAVHRAVAQARRGGWAVLGGYFHPDELLDHKLSRRQLYTGGHLRRNAAYAVELAERNAVQPLFVTASQAAEAIAGYTPV